MPDYSALCGWVRNDAAVQAYSAELEAQTPGYRARFADAHPDLRDYHKQHEAVFLFEAEYSLEIAMGDGSVKPAGQFFKADLQARGTCFPAGSLVRMADGTEKPIEQVKVGDLVVTHTGKARRVLEIGKRDYTGDMYSLQPSGLNKRLTLTAEHPVAKYVAEHDTLDWPAAHMLHTDDKLVCPRVECLQRYFGDSDVEQSLEFCKYGVLIPLALITQTRVKDITVYNLEVDEDHSYLIHGIAVHNCVGRGTYKAAQDAYLWPIYKGLVAATPKQLAYELIYGGSRSLPTIGNGSLGGGDGSVGAWAAKFVHDYGLLERGVHGPYDLRSSNEMLAVALGQPRAHIDQNVLAECAKHKAYVAHRCDTIQEIADVLAAGGGIAFCSNTIWGNRNAEGIARPSSSGGHCEAIRGYFWSTSGELSFVRQQSWGNAPGGPDVLVHKYGKVQLPQGGYGAYGRDVAAALRNGGEAWGFTSVQGWALSGTLGDHI